MSVPINDYAEANEELANMSMKEFFSCCGKSICGGCVHSFIQSGNSEKCPFCNSRTGGKTVSDRIEELMKRVEANDAVAVYMLAGHYYHEGSGLQQDLAKGVELYARAAELGSGKAHFALGYFYDEGGDLKKAKFHYEAAAIAGDEVARNNLGTMEEESGNVERAVKHWIIAASAGSFRSMNVLLGAFNHGFVSPNAMDSTLTAYNKSCAEMRSEARDAFIRSKLNQ
jgi:TPR repeat protein